MLVKLVLAAVLTVGVLGRNVPEDVAWYDKLVASGYCDRDKIPQLVTPFNTFKQCLAGAFRDESFQYEVRQGVTCFVCVGQTSSDRQSGVITCPTQTKHVTPNVIKIRTLNNNKGQIAKAFCSKSSQMKNCIHPLISSLGACFTATGMRNSKQSMDQAIDFICANDGAKMISFLNEGGKECMGEKVQDFKSCKNAKTSSIARLVDVYGSGPAIPETERCKLDKQEDDCTIAAMKTCSNPTPAKLVEEMVNTVRTSCSDE